MAENESSSPAQPSSAPPANAKVPTKSPDNYDRGHVPMGEEFDKPKWTLPPWQPVAIALAIVAIVVGVIAYFNRAQPPASGGIDEVTAVNIPGDSVLVAVNIHFANATDNTIFVHTMKATVETAKGPFSDDAANASDYARYYSAFPDLKQNAKPPLLQDTRIARGANGIGTLIFSFPVPKDVFDARKSLTVTVQPYDTPPIVLKK